jgi:hypothetical protein
VSDFGSSERHFAPIKRLLRPSLDRSQPCLMHQQSHRALAGAHEPRETVRMGNIPRIVSA